MVVSGSSLDYDVYLGTCFYSKYYVNNTASESVIDCSEEAPCRNIATVFEKSENTTTVVLV
jgi:hypothetical protein